MKLIYTGYGWRKLTLAELVLNEDRPVNYIKPDNPEAGDIYEISPRWYGTNWKEQRGSVFRSFQFIIKNMNQEEISQITMILVMAMRRILDDLAKQKKEGAK